MKNTRCPFTGRRLFIMENSMSEVKASFRFRVKLCLFSWRRVGDICLTHRRDSSDYQLRVMFMDNLESRIALLLLGFLGSRNREQLAIPRTYDPLKF